jgi:2-polyprenyl-3-methyl-5-hydroxy-6-metoxy-1,4-benzoquinol methylase
MSRIDFASKLLREVETASVLDVGCRDAELAECLPAGTIYAGADLFPDDKGHVKYVGDITTLDIPDRYDTVVALDILEHLDRPSTVFDRLAGIARRHLLVSLPNCYDLKSRVRFAAGRPLGGKYLFNETETLDRHRWLMTRAEIHAFFEAKARKHDMDLQIVDMKYGASGHATMASRGGRLLAGLLPSGLTTATVYGLFTRHPS